MVRHVRIFLAHPHKTFECANWEAMTIDIDPLTIGLTDTAGEAAIIATVFTACFGIGAALVGHHLYSWHSGAFHYSLPSGIRAGDVLVCSVGSPSVLNQEIVLSQLIVVNVALFHDGLQQERSSHNLYDLHGLRRFLWLLSHPSHLKPKCWTK